MKIIKTREFERFTNVAIFCFLKEKIKIHYLSVMFGVWFFILFTGGITHAQAMNNGSSNTDFLRIDYYVWERHINNFPPKDLRRIRSLDVLIFFHTDWKSDGSISFPERALTHLAKLKKVLRPETEIWIGAGDLSPLINNPAKTQKFCDSVQQLATQYGFKGLDIDWEFHFNTSQYKSVIQALSNKLRKNGFRISTSHGAPGSYYSNVTAATKDMVDWCNLQFYWSTQNAYSVAMMASILQDYLNKGVPAHGLAIGVPIYACQDSSNYHGGPMEVGWSYVYERGADPNKNVVTTPEGYTYYYSGIPLLKDKVKFAFNHGYRGVFTWEITCDINYSSKDSLLRKIDEEVASFSPGQDSDGDGMPDVWEVRHNLNQYDQTDRDSDADSDKVSNYEEYLAGTDPQKTNSKLQLQLKKKNDGTISLLWKGISGRRYKVWKSDNLKDWSNLTDEVKEDKDEILETSVSTMSSRGFFKLSVQKEPTNALYNPSWEEAGPSGWTFKRAQWGPVRSGHWGFQCLEPDYSKYIMSSQKMSVKPGQTVTMSAYGYFTPYFPFSAGDTAFYEMRFYDAQGNELGGYMADWWGNHNTPKNTWIQHSYSHIAPANAVKVVCFFSVYWDGVQENGKHAQFFYDDASVTIENTNEEN